VSDGTINICKEVRARAISMAADKGFMVLTEVGKKNAGQLKKMDANQLEYYFWWDNNHIGNKLKPYGQVKKTEMFRMQRGYALNAQFSYLQGYVQEVKKGNQTLIYISESNKRGADVAVIRITGNTAIFINGRDADAEDIEENDSIIAVVNPAGIAFVVSVSNDRYRFDDSRGLPDIVKLVPADGAKNVEVGLKELVATFDKYIYGLEKEDYIESAIRVTNITDNKRVSVSDIDIEGRELYIKLSSGLDKNCKYSVYIPSGLFEDSNDNEFDGIARGDWEFTTAKDYNSEAPGILRLTPSNGAKDVKVGLEKLVATFDKNIYGLESESVIKSRIKIYNLTNRYDTITVTDIDIVGRELQIYLSDGLDEDCKYSVYIPSGLFEDYNDNEFDGIARGDWEFTTAEVNDDDAPVVNKLVPANNARVSDLRQIYIDFNERIRWVDTDLKNQVFVFKLSNSNDLLIPNRIVIDNNRLLLTFSNKLDRGEYGVAITSGVIEDLYGNDFNGISINKWRFEVI